MSLSSQIVPQPDHFYGQVEPVVPPIGRSYLHPDDDPHAARGIPVFKPSMEEFLDFEQYMNKVECWGMKSGIIKIIPPKEWSDALPSTVPQLAKVKLRNPIEQEFVGGSGVFRQQNMEKRRIMSVREWVELCAKDDLRSPTKYEVERGRRYTTGTPSTRSRRSTRIAEDVVKLEDDDVKMSETRNDDDEPADTDPTLSLPTPPHAPQSPTPDPSQAEPTHLASNRRSAAERHKAKETLDAAFFEQFDPHKQWLPKGIAPEDYTPEFCKALERMYWRSCGLGRSPWYGADMKGSLFTEETKHWNVATLPSVLSRLLGPNSQISGVNTPYLYFGMWRATFAWHVEDMDLFSINYIHFGSPKHWYAVPQARAQALETTMKGYFPLDTSSCPQFLRHKSFLASPSLLAKSSVKPNVLVQHAGEFVVTFPRGYHAGFNLGLNCAESTNFALDSWVELGLKAAFCGCVADSVRIDVRGLIEAKRQREASRNTPAKKRKVEVFIDNSKFKRSKMAPPSPESIAEGNPPKAKSNKPRPTATVAASSLASTDADEPAFPCCLCVSLDVDGLLPVNDPPSSASGLTKPRDGVWRAHETCARVIPETWVDEVTDTGQGLAKVVWGVDGIVKDRWMLKCAACTRLKHKTHGAPIQCTKGKCSKAFHVSCAIAGHSDTSYRIIEETDKEVVLLEPEIAADVASTVPDTELSNSEQPTNATPAPPAPKVLKTIKKYSVEVLCSQHNPTMIARRKANKDDKLKADVMALKEMDRIKIRNSSGAFEVSLVKVYEDRGTVEVLWDGGLKREFRWGSIVWNNDAQMAGRKPTAEEVKENPPPPPAPVFAPVRAVPPSSHQTSDIASLAGAPVAMHPQAMFISPVARPNLQPHPTFTQAFLRLTPQHVHKPHPQDQTSQSFSGSTDKTSTRPQLPSPSPSINYAYGYPPYPYPYPYSYAPYQPYVGSTSASSPYPPSLAPPTTAADGSGLGTLTVPPATTPSDEARPVTTPDNPVANTVTQIPAATTKASSIISSTSQSAAVLTPTTPASIPPNSAQLPAPILSTQQHPWAYPYYNSPLASPSSPLMVAGNHHLHLPPNMHAYYQQHYARLLNGGAGVTSAVLSAMNTTTSGVNPSSTSQTESSAPPTTATQSVQQQ